MERAVPGIEGTTRVLARADGGSEVVVGRPVAGRPRRDARQPRGVVRDRRSRSPSRSRPCSATRSPPPGCDRSRRCAAARRTSRSAATTSGFRCPRRTTRSAASGRRSTRCSIACAARSSASGASWPTRATSCAPRWRSSRPSWRARCAPAGTIRRCARRSSPPWRSATTSRSWPRTCWSSRARARASCPCGPSGSSCASCSSACARRFADRAGERGRTISVDADGGQSVLRRRAAAAPGARQPRRQRAALRRRARSCCGPVAQGRASSSRSPIRARGSRPSSPSAPSSASRAAISLARGRAPGLGLSIVRAIAEAHGGRAEVAAGRGRDRAALAARQPGASGSSQIAGVASRSQRINPVRGGETR